MNNSLFIIAGEASGDAYGAHLVEALRQRAPLLNIFAMGGQQLEVAGATLVVDSTELAVVGFFEVFSKLNKIRKAFQMMTRAIAKRQPSLVILIDYPGFNLRIAKKIKQVSPKTRILYYISPQIWAWRYHRIQIIKQYVDLMAVIFPFEVAIYEKAHVPVKFVGHPLAGRVITSLSSRQLRPTFHLKEESIVIGLLPGSRLSEIKYLLPTLLRSAEILATRFSNSEFILPLAPSLKESDLTPYLKTTLNIRIIQHRTYDAIATCNAIIIASGTATLEAALLKTPMVIVYKGSPLSFALAKRLVKIDFVGLCNIVAGERIVTELLQNEATPESIANEINRILEDHSYRETMLSKLNTVKMKLEQAKGSDSLDNLALEWLTN